LKIASMPLKPRMSDDRHVICRNPFACRPALAKGEAPRPRRDRRRLAT